MTRACVNKGGSGSCIDLERVPRLEEHVPLTPLGLAALDYWRARPGQILTVRDPEGGWYRARLVERSGNGAVVFPFHRLGDAIEPERHVVVYQALPEKERFELVLQKLTELGISRIVPFASKRSSTLSERDSGQKKSHRWPDVVLRASLQCRRGMIPELAPVLSWPDVLQEACDTELRLLLYEAEGQCSFRSRFAHNPSSVALVVGPEGGFDPEEVDDARLAGFEPVSLGPRILRTETAAIVGAGMIQYELGAL